MRISDWSSDVCSSDLIAVILAGHGQIFTLLGHADLGREIARENKLPEFLEKRCNVGDFPVHRRRQQRVLMLGCRLGARHLVVRRSEERRGGKGCVSTCRYVWCAYQ